MKKFGFALSAVVISVVLTGLNSRAVAQEGCTTLKEGTLTYSSTHYLAGTPMMTGVNPYGYNYQAHLFNGTYFNVYAGSAGLPPYDGDDEAYLGVNPTAATHWAWPYRNDEVGMKWNDAWLSNRDCDGDGLLDRHYGFPSYIGSGAWETNHLKGVYSLEGKEITWTAFTKIVAAPADAALSSGTWLATDGTEIGPVLWGEFITIQDIYNDPGAGVHGVAYLTPYAAGFGRFGPK